MFWNRSAREARRKKILDDLIELTPEERRLRMDQAVAEGDLPAGEVDQALRIVSRLDALRVQRVSVVPEAVPSAGEKADERPKSASTQTPAKPAKKARRRGSVEATPEPTEAAVLGSPSRRRNRSGPPEVAVRKTGHGIGGSPRQRRLRLKASVAAKTAATASTSVDTAGLADTAGPADAPLATDTVSETKPEENWPDISWLRP